MSKARSAARLAAVQALYQLDMEGTPMARLLHEFHQHRFGATIGDATFVDPEMDFFNDVVKGVDARKAEIDGLVAKHLAKGWSLERLDRTLVQILRAGCYELLARPDIPTGSVISEYLNVAEAFFDRREKAFVNAVLDAAAKALRQRI